jgi:hypothetical protein
VFPYRLAFIDLKTPEATRPPKDPIWEGIEQAINVLFWIDLFINFFCSYEDPDGREISSPKRIFWNYMTSYFFINLIGCIPVSTIQNLISASTFPNKGARLIRLQRLSRLMRLMRLLRLAKFRAFMQKNWLWRWVQEHVAGVRILNLLACLMTSAHILACCWYIIAVIEIDASNNWLARRALDDERTLLDASGQTQWLHSFYFIFTIFTTVGFGDMSGLTVIEIWYVLFVMTVGAILHSIIVSEMITALTNVDARKKTISAQTELLNLYSEHAELGNKCKSQLKDWIERPRKSDVDFDRDGMAKLITTGKIPRDLVAELSLTLFDGKLTENAFVTVCKVCLNGQQPIPPRFPVLLSLVLAKTTYTKDDVVYHEHDHPFNLFIITSTGLFAYARDIVTSMDVPQFLGFSATSM